MTLVRRIATVAQPLSKDGGDARNGNTTMPFKQAFGAAAVPVAGASAVALAAAIGYILYTGSPNSGAPNAPITVTSSAPQSVSKPVPITVPSVESAAPQTAPVDAPVTADVPSEQATATASPKELPKEVSKKGQAPTVQDDPLPQDNTVSAEMAPALAAPTVDVVRIPPTGISTVAGHAEPGSEIMIYVDGVEVARASAGANGDYVSLFDIPAVDRPRELQIAAQKGDARVFASGSIVIAPFLAAPVSQSDMTDTATIAMATEPDADVAPVMLDRINPASIDAPEAGRDGDGALPVEQDVASETSDPISIAPQAPENTEPKPLSSSPLTSRPAPTVMVADDTGVKILQSAAPLQGVSIDAITYDPKGAVFASGRGQAGAVVRLYLSNAALMDATVGPDGQWRAKMDVDAGIYSLRADMIDADGKVLSRVEIPFKREDIAVLARLSQSAVETATPSPEADQNDLAAMQSAADAAPDMVATKGDTVSNVAPVPAAQSAPQSRITSVTVQPGNTLWGIASDTYGDGFLYARVFNANVARIRDPDLIYPGQVFVLPKE